MVFTKKYKGMSFQQIMTEQRAVNRWFIVAVFVAGAFAGAMLAIAFSFAALA